MFNKHINKNNLHHAYLIEGEKEIIPSLLDFFNSELDIKTNNNPDFYLRIYDSFKIDDARELSPIKNEKPCGNNKKLVVIYANSFLKEAQNSLLKMFEEPIKDVVFCLITRDTKNLLKTFVSRFYIIPKSIEVLDFENKEIINFIEMNYRERINFIKEFLALNKEDKEDSLRVHALKFLDSLELYLYNKNILKIKEREIIFKKIFKTREYLREPSSNYKMLFESLALILPEKI